MYHEHFQLTQPPFAETLDPELFFPGAMREEICRSLALDLLAGKPLLKLVGEEGTGKTLLCRVLEQRLPENCRLVRLDCPSGSFEDLLRIVRLALGGTDRGSAAQMEPLPELQCQLGRLREQGIRVVLMIDEAEKLFLAPLERLVRHVAEGSGGLQLILVLVGRPALDAHLKQMASLSGETLFSNSYTLSALSESETRQYLRFRASGSGMSRQHFAEVFTDGTVTKIFQAAQGNLRLINILAEEALQNFCAEKSFMVLLDHVGPETTVAAEGRSTPLRQIVRLLSGNRLLAAALVGGVVVLLALGLFVGRSGDRPAPLPGKESVPQSSSTSLQQKARRDGEALFRQRVSAASQWQASGHQGQYTIQLMMLASPTAQSSLAGTLASDEYAAILDQVYILPRQSTPPTLFVFYGIYDSLDTAREARNGMPVFLRKHQPYPLAISEALRKIEP
nr:AAA family ATPase [uncultured Desulfobulbus sp.]